MIGALYVACPGGSRCSCLSGAASRARSESKRFARGVYMNACIRYDCVMTQTYETRIDAASLDIDYANATDDELIAAYRRVCFVPDTFTNMHVVTIHDARLSAADVALRFDADPADVRAYAIDICDSDPDDLFDLA